MIRLAALAALLLGLAHPVAAQTVQTAQPSDAMAWLEKIASAARRLNYSGTFVYQYGQHAETSRIVHMVEGGSEHEKLESMDGSEREIVRSDDELRCFLPGSRTVRIEKRSARKSFPALLPEQLSTLSESYAVRKGDVERVGGFECQTLTLEPRDGMRYRHKLWADVNSGLLLKAAMIDEKGQVVEQFTFTQLTIGGAIDPQRLKPRSGDKAWREIRSSPEAATVDSGWTVKSLPAGFRKTMEMKRAIEGKPSPVTHIVFSDGLVAVSVFIEPMANASRPPGGASSQGAINVVTRPVGDHVVTVLGETPSATVRQVADSVSYRGK